MKEIPNKNALNPSVEFMPFKKFAQSKKKCLYDEDTILINGTFMEKKTKVIIKGDIFNAHILGKLSIKEIYKIYLEWFNYTRDSTENEREFVSVKRVIQKQEKVE